MYAGLEHRGYARLDDCLRPDRHTMAALPSAIFPANFLLPRRNVLPPNCLYRSAGHLEGDSIQKGAQSSLQMDAEVATSRMLLRHLLD